VTTTFCAISCHIDSVVTSVHTLFFKPQRPRQSKLFSTMQHILFIVIINHLILLMVDNFNRNAACIELQSAKCLHFVCQCNLHVNPVFKHKTGIKTPYSAHSTLGTRA